MKLKLFDMKLGIIWELQITIQVLVQLVSQSWEAMKTCVGAHAVKRQLNLTTQTTGGDGVCQKIVLLVEAVANEKEF